MKITNDAMNTPLLDSLLAQKAALDSSADSTEKLLLVVGALVMIGVAGESIFGVKAFLNNRKLQAVQRSIDTEREEIARKEAQASTAAIVEAQRGAEEARATAKGFESKIAESDARVKSAEAQVASAMAASQQASAKAEGFRADIAKANESAEQARAQVASATAEAAKANLELARLKQPRTIENIDTLVDELKRFKGIEYDFRSVFQDPEAFGVAIAIDSLLQRAEWTKVKSPPGFPGINLYGKEDGFGIPIGFNVGIQVIIDSPDSKMLPSLPLDKLPDHVKAAVALRQGLLGRLSPRATDKDVPLVDAQPADSKTVHIAVGRKL
jgi:hypothetical protein